MRSVKLQYLLHTPVNDVSTGSNLFHGLCDAVNASKIDLALHSGGMKRTSHCRSNVTVELAA